MTHPETRIKMCGMTRKEDIAQAAFLGVDAIGLVFYADSKRAVTIEQAKMILADLPLFLSVVAVLVNPDSEFVHCLTTQLPLHYLQFHGNESPDFCSAFNKPYIKAIAASSRGMIDDAKHTYQQASAILLDTPSNEYGGSGKTFDWQMIPSSDTIPLILAGGLDVLNVREAVAIAHPSAVDVSSGIEQSPGIKDSKKMTQFVNALRGNRHE